MKSERAKVLLVDDNRNVRSFLRPVLEDAGFTCIEAEDGWTALSLIADEQPDLVVLDILLGEGMNGIQVCEQVRQRGFTVPVIFLTILDRTVWPNYLPAAFRAGGNDYVEKREELKRLQALERKMGLPPTDVLEGKSDLAELVARIRARLPQRAALVEIDEGLRIDHGASRALVWRLEPKKPGQWVDAGLTPTEFGLLSALLERPGPVGKVQLLDLLQIDGDEHDIESHVNRLRRKIEPDPSNPRYVLTYHRVGYRFLRRDRGGPGT